VLDQHLCHQVASVALFVSGADRPEVAEQRQFTVDGSDGQQERITGGRVRHQPEPVVEQPAEVRLGVPVRLVGMNLLVVFRQLDRSLPFLLVADLSPADAAFLRSSRLAPQGLLGRAERVLARLSRKDERARGEAGDTRQDGTR
jgi:hypothetical protein